jgi:hypothetical protein
MITMTSLHKKMLWGVILVLCCVAALKGIHDLFKIVTYEFGGAMDSDVAIYFIVARGMLNGLRPYTDIFESKPPGMFLLSMLSLLITGGQYLLSFFSGLIYIIIPGSLGIYAYVRSNKTSLAWTMLSVLLAIIGGIVVATFLEDRAGAAQTESFGSLFGCLYALSIVWDSKNYPKTMLAIRSLLLLATLGLKEPFVLTIIGVAVILTKRPRDLLTVFVLPACIGGCIAVVFMLLSGILMPYITILLPAMIGGRVGSTSIEPLWTKTFAVGRVFANITTYYVTPLFGWLMATLWCIAPALRSKNTDAPSIAVSIVQGICGYYSLLSIFILSVAAYVHFHSNLYVIDYSLPWEITKIVFCLAILGTCFFFFSRQRRMVYATLCTFVALMCAALAVGISNYLSNHFAFPVPIYYSLVLLFIHVFAKEQQVKIPHILIPLLLISTVFAQSISEKHAQYLKDRSHFTAGELLPITQKFEALMNSCGYTKYFGPVAFQELSFSHFSPVGPLPIPTFHEYLGYAHPLQKNTAQNVHDFASVILVPKGDPLPPYLQSSTELFAKDPPVCAQGLLPIHDKWDVYFRK